MLKMAAIEEAAMSPAAKDRLRLARCAASHGRDATRPEGSGAPCKYLQRRVSPRLHARGGGFSLIEVVIALAVFLFGALAIVRIFPGAIGVIQTSEQRNVAQRMAQTTQARYTISPLTVPEAIVDVDPDAQKADPTGNETGWSDFAGSAYGTATINESLPREAPGPDDISFDNSQTPSTQIANTAAGHFRRVIGEEHVVEQEGSGANARGVITLRYPYVQPEASATNEVKAVHQPRLYTTTVIEGVTITRTGTLDFSNSPYSDTTGGDPRRVRDDLRIDPTITPPKRQMVTFYVSYRWHNAGGPINSVVDEPKRFPKNGPSWAASPPLAPQGTEARVLEAALNSTTIGFGTPTGFAIVDGPVQVKMRQLVSNPLVAQDALNRNLGRIVLGPGEVGNPYSVDYSVPDWRMIVHDDNLSTKLSSPSTTQSSNDQTDQSFLQEQDASYTFGSGGTVTSPRVTTVPTKFITEDAVGQNTAVAPSQVYALVKGTRPSTTTPGTSEIVSSIAQWSPDKFTTSSRIDYGAVTPAPGAGDPRALGVRPKSGQVFFDVNGLVAPSARVVYRNVDGWLEQPSVAARSYVPYDSQRVGLTNPEWWPREPWREYVWDTTDGALYFHPSETGKTVLATYQYQVGTNPTDPIFTMRDVPLTTWQEVVPQPPDAAFNGFALKPNSAATDKQAARAYFVDNQGRCIGSTAANDTNTSKPTASTATHIVAILSIKGASVRVRSAWFDSGRYSQSDVAGYRSLDVESQSRS